MFNDAFAVVSPYIDPVGKVGSRSVVAYRDGRLTFSICRVVERSGDNRELLFRAGSRWQCHIECKLDGFADQVYAGDEVPVVLKQFEMAVDIALRHPRHSPVMLATFTIQKPCRAILRVRAVTSRAVAIAQWSPHQARSTDRVSVIPDRGPDPGAGAERPVALPPALTGNAP
jgi:hypothetical protein